MTSAPTWTPLIVAIVGVLGTLAAAVFAQVWQTRREAERWERERKREREIWIREDTRRYFDQEREAHMAFLREWQQIHINLWPYAKGQKQRNGDTGDPLAALHPRFLDIVVFGTPEAKALADNCMATLRKWGQSEGGDNEIAARSAMTSAFDAYIRQIRIDLGVTARARSDRDMPWTLDPEPARTDPPSS
jgi:hypothetical protein